MAGAPDGNRNAETHGAYAKVYDDTLTDDEAKLLTDEASVDDYVQEQIGFVRIRMRRVTAKINKARELWPEAENALSGLQRELRQLLKLRAELRADREQNEDKIDDILDRFDAIRSQQDDYRPGTGS